MSIKYYSRVQLITNDFVSDGVSAGAIGFVIEIYPDGFYEVEFSLADGTTVAQIVAKESDLKLAEIPV